MTDELERVYPGEGGVGGVSGVVSVVEVSPVISGSHSPNVTDYHTVYSLFEILLRLLLQVEVS